MSESPLPPSHPSPGSAARPRRQPFTRSVGNGSARETFESIVIAFLFAFLFRAFVVEAFVIPTGSMAPTLLGEHVRMRCPQCGYRFPLGPGRRFTSGAVPCPMCRNPIALPSGGRVSGDRILVLKYLYAFSEPRRWDVVVFKNPTDPTENYIKRLVGLPGEQLQIVGGNVYTRPLGPDGRPSATETPWTIQRKPPDAQRAVWQPVFHSDYLPLDGGEVDSPRSHRSREWRVPWRPAGASAEGWAFHRRGASWRYRDPAGRAGTLRFDFAPYDAYNFYSYNMLLRGEGNGRSTVHEMRIAATVTPDQEGARLSLTTSGERRLLRAVVEPDGAVLLESASPSPDPEASASTEWVPRVKRRIAPLPAGRATRVELWHVDRALSLWIDGRRVARWTYENQWRDTISRRPDLPPLAQITLSGASARFDSVNLDRDLYYTQTGQRSARGTHGQPVVIPEDRFFCLGDNSPQSQDSRLWKSVNPWVRELTGVRKGLVPRDLMIGRAFFVYWPAMWRFRAGGMLLVPNFSDMRFIK